MAAVIALRLVLSAATCGVAYVNRYYTRPVANGVLVGALREVGIY